VLLAERLIRKHGDLALLGLALVGFDAARGIMSLRWIVQEDMGVIGPMALT
jgi:hypothetical protein